MENFKYKPDNIECLQIKLLNALKGSALSVTMATDSMMTPQEKLEEMKAIEQMTNYIKNYQQNIQILGKYKGIDR